MKKFKIAFYIICFLFLAISVLFALFTERMFDQFGMLKFLRFLEIWAWIGMGLFALEWIIENLNSKKLKNRIFKLEKEKEMLKVRLFDMEEEKRKSDQALKPRDPSREKPGNENADPNSTDV